MPAPIGPSQTPFSARSPPVLPTGPPPQVSSPLAPGSVGAPSSALPCAAPGAPLPPCTAMCGPDGPARLRPPKSGHVLPRTATCGPRRLRRTAMCSPDSSAWHRLSQSGHSSRRITCTRTGLPGGTSPSTGAALHPRLLAARPGGSTTSRQPRRPSPAQGSRAGGSRRQRASHGHSCETRLPAACALHRNSLVSGPEDLP